MILKSAIALYAGGVGSGCNPAVAEPRCGRPSGSNATSNVGSRNFTLNNGRVINVSFDKATQSRQLARIRQEEMAKLPKEVQEGFAKGLDTEAMNKKDGKWLPARQTHIHDPINEKMLAGHTSQQQPELKIIAGGTASGKSMVTKVAKSELASDFVEVNSDHFRQMLPEAAAFVGNGKQGALQEESGYIRDQVFENALALKYHIVLDAPGSKGVAAMADRAEKLGYKVSYYYVHRDLESAQQAANERPFVTRNLADLREVPDDITENSHVKSRGAYGLIGKPGREVRVYDREGMQGGEANLVYHRTGDGMVHVNDAARMEAINRGQKNAKLPRLY